MLESLPEKSQQIAVRCPSGFRGSRGLQVPKEPGSARWGRAQAGSPETCFLSTGPCSSGSTMALTFSFLRQRMTAPDLTTPLLGFLTQKSRVCKFIMDQPWGMLTFLPEPVPLPTEGTGGHLRPFP